jgi:hypothetical protein
MALLCCLCGLTGCAAWRAPPQPLANPLLVPVDHPDLLWNPLVDVMDDYFEIAREVPVHVEGDVVTEGRLETRPQIGATLLEPWRHDSVTRRDQLESTLQTIRRQALARVIPTAGGYEVSVVVLKELEDVRRPSFATTSASVFRNDNSLHRFADPISDTPIQAGWIPLGNDVALEQEILHRLQLRLSRR